MGPDVFTKHFMAKSGDRSLARWQAMLCEQFGDCPVRGALLAQFRDDIFRGKQVLEFLRAARYKFRNSFAEIIWIKRGHKPEWFGVEHQNGSMMRNPR